MAPQWVYPPPVPMEQVDKLVHTLGLPPIVAELLVRRGLTTRESIEEFFNPNLEDLPNPLLLHDMEKAINRIAKAIECKEKILVYGDYDVDGITSVATLMVVLRELGGKLSYYIPDRVKEGYGFSVIGVDKAKEEGAGLIVTVDCGINSNAEVKYAQESGIDVIICDHHEPQEELPSALAILNPKKLECSYPNPHLAGVGVSFKLAQSLIHHFGLPNELLDKIVALAAVGTTADVVPLIGENRTLVKRGLEQLNSCPNDGLKALIRTSGLENKLIDTWNILFVIAPRLNACGRMGNAGRGVELLTTTDPQVRQDIAHDLETENYKRRREDERIFKEAMEIIEQSDVISNHKAIILAQEGWHPGVIGVAAARIVEKFHRPTILITYENGVGRGSARSIVGFDIFQALNDCKSYLKEYGGHKYAAGLSITSEMIEPFSIRFQEIAESHITQEVLTPKLEIDSIITLDQIDSNLVKYLELFAPFGISNHRPIFAAHDLRPVGSVRVVSGNHLKFKVRQGNSVLDAIGFNMGEQAYRIESSSQIFSMAFTIELNQWAGNTYIQLKVKDLK